jgi:hypothetical protein
VVEAKETQHILLAVRTFAAPVSGACCCLSCRASQLRALVPGSQDRKTFHAHSSSYYLCYL